jgi:hypothetical protein
MGWHIHYQFLRATPLTLDEIGKLAALNLKSATEVWDGSPFGVHVAETPRADHVLAEGTTQFPMGDHFDDSDRLEVR